MWICKIQPPKSPCFPTGMYAGFSIWTSQAGTCLVFPEPQLLNFSKYRKNVGLPFTASSESTWKVWRHELTAWEFLKSCGAWFSLESLGLALPPMQLSSVRPFPLLLQLCALVLPVGREQMSIRGNLQAVAPLGGNNPLKGVEAVSVCSFLQVFAEGREGIFSHHLPRTGPAVLGGLQPLPVQALPLLPLPPRAPPCRGCSAPTKGSPGVGCPPWTAASPSPLASLNCRVPPLSLTMCGEHRALLQQPA